MRALIKIEIPLIFLLIVITLQSCRNDDVPKPRGYFRIDMPERKYRVFDSLPIPYRFEYPVYANIRPKNDSLGKPAWIDLNFPGFKGSCYLSYLPVNNNLSRYCEDSRTLVLKHMPKSDGIEEILVSKPGQKVYGTIYLISGTNTASSYQFYLTDSTKHFLRGALYFNSIPNNDSLQPVIDFVTDDLNHLIQSFEWK